MKAPPISKPSDSKARRLTRRFSKVFPAGSREPSTVETTTGPQTVPANTSFESSRRCSNAVFRLEAPHAGTVKLAADFTSWEKRTLDLRPAQDGTWRITVLLPPGRYAYRFLVDDEWHDDPSCSQYEISPFGTRNAVIEVT